METAAGVAPLLETTGLWKTFPGVVALRDVSFECRRGEIHGLIGENGAGKSTLMRVVAGVYQPDRGTIRFDGQKVDVDNPSMAFGLGIAMVHQDTRLAPDLTVLQNMWLGHELLGPLGVTDLDTMAQRAREALRSFEVPIDIDAPVYELGVAHRQIVEIAKALLHNARLLILDEPTAPLGTREVSQLFRILGDLRRKGTSIVFISHRLPEVLTIADRITVMKDGEVTGTVETANVDEERIIRMMIGRDSTRAFPPKATGVDGAPALEVRGLSSGIAFEDISFTVRRGEIVGIAGVEGNGQREIARSLFGVVPITKGSVTIAGRAESLRTPQQAIRAGLIYLSNDRRREGLMLSLSVLENMALPNLSLWQRLGFVDGSGEKKAIAGVARDLAIRTPSMGQSVEFLSGGNQQKVAVGRWLLSKRNVFVFDEPTLGMDVGAKISIYELIRNLANEGAGVIVVSSDMIEVIGLCDRVLVVSAGHMVCELTGDDITEERIVSAACANIQVRPTRLEPAASAAPAETTVAPQRPAEAIVDKEQARLKRRRWLSIWGPSVLVGLIFLALTVVTSFQSPYFLTATNLGDLFKQASPLVLASMGQTLVLLLGGVDLSNGAVISLTTTIASYVLIGPNPLSIALGVLICLAAGALVGLVNGLAIRHLRIPDLLATLATQSIVMGLALTVRPSPGGRVDMGFMEAMTATVGPVPVVPVVVLVIVIVVQYILLRTRLGLALYATGSSKQAAFASGIPIERVRVLAYMASGTLAALAGLYVAARIGSGDPQVGANFTLNSVTSSVIGGVDLFGGRGTVIGAYLGSLLVVGMQNFFNLLHITAYYQYVWTGLLTLLAVGLYSLGSRRR